MGEAPRLVSGFEGAPWRRRSCGGCCLYGTTPCLLIPGPWNCDSGEQRGPRTRTRTDLKAPPPGGRGHSDQDGPEGPSPGGRGHSDAAGLRPGHVAPSFPSHGARGLHPRAKGRTSTHILGEQRSARWSLGGGSPSLRDIACLGASVWSPLPWPRAPSRPGTFVPTSPHCAPRGAEQLASSGLGGFAMRVSAVCVDNPVGGR